MTTEQSSIESDSWTLNSKQADNYNERALQLRKLHDNGIVTEDLF